MTLLPLKKHFIKYVFDETEQIANLCLLTRKTSKRK